MIEYQSKPQHSKIAEFLWNKNDISQAEIQSNFPDINQVDANRLTLLHWIIKLDRRDVFEKLLKIPELNFSIEDAAGNIPLQLAINLERKEMMADLAICQPAFLDRNGQHILIKTVSDSDLETARILVEELHVDVKQIDKKTPLLEVYCKNIYSNGKTPEEEQQQENIKLVDLLLRNGARLSNKLNLTDSSLSPNLLYIHAKVALQQGDLEYFENLCVQLSLKQRYHEDKNSIKRFLLTAASKGDIESVTTLLTRKKISIEDINNMYDWFCDTVLAVAVENGQIEFIKSMYKKNIFSKNFILSDKIRSCILAARAGQMGFVKWMLQEGIITKKEIKSQKIFSGMSALFHAAEKGRIKFVEWMLQEDIITKDEIKAQKTDPGMTALHHAAQNGRIKFVEWMLQEGIITKDEINTQKNNDGLTMLLCAVIKGQYEFIESMLQKEIITAEEIKNQKNNFGDTALALAIINVKEDCIRWLLNKVPETVFDYNVAASFKISRSIFDAKEELKSLMIQTINKLLNQKFNSYDEEIAVIEQVEKYYPQILDKEHGYKRKAQCFGRWQNHEKAYQLHLEVWETNSSKELKDFAGVELANLFFLGYVSTAEADAWIATHSSEFAMQQQDNLLDSADKKATLEQIQGAIHAFQYLIHNNDPSAEQLLVYCKQRLQGFDRLQQLNKDEPWANVASDYFSYYYGITENKCTDIFLLQFFAQQLLLQMKQLQAENQQLRLTTKREMPAGAKNSDVNHNSSPSRASAAMFYHKQENIGTCSEEFISGLQTDCFNQNSIPPILTFA